jgi:hypothetical protein
MDSMERTDPEETDIAGTPLLLQEVKIVGKLYYNGVDADD